MRSIEILDIKDFMQLLLQSSAFDSYEFISGEMRTDMLYTLDGHLNKDFFSEEELSDRADFRTPHAVSSGIHSVYVNGVLSFSDGRICARRGKILKKCWKNIIFDLTFYKNGVYFASYLKRV